MPRELIVIAKNEIGLRLSEQGLVSDQGTDLTALTSAITARGGTLRALFQPPEGAAAAPEQQALPPPAGPPSAAAELGMQAETEADDGLPPFSSFFAIDAEDGQLDALAEDLLKLDLFDVAYVKPEAEPAPDVAGFTSSDLAGAPAAPGATADHSSRQGYLGAAPDGVDASYAWTLAGGAGDNIRVIDIEGGWNLTHEDLQVNKGGLLFGTQLAGSATDPYSWENHGTAVLGELGGDANGIGVTGICNKAWIAVASHSVSSSKAIFDAANLLRAGDVLLLEMHRPGPVANFTANNTQLGYIAVEWWPDDLKAIRYAVSRGVIVVEAAGNGAQNLDDPIYDARPANFVPAWTNPFNAANRGSGAVLVGAGAPPPGTHGRDNGPARSRLDFSNYGSRLDCQGWGREVTSTGYGDLLPDAALSRDRWYTDTFSGTSSASPIIAGVIASVNGFLLARGTTGPLTPSLARMWLRATGSAQQDEPTRPATQRIGNLPDLRQILTAI